jgi:GxxExxY protein
VGEIVFKQESYAIIGACFEVYREMGCGFLEAVYDECLTMEMQMRGIPFAWQVPLALVYKNRRLKKTYAPDYICYEKIVVELKAVKELADEHRAQVHNYLKASGVKLGLLVNFGHYPKLEYERIVR